MHMAFRNDSPSDYLTFTRFLAALSRYGFAHAQKPQAPLLRFNEIKEINSVKVNP